MKQFFTLLAAVLLTATTYAQIGINNETAKALDKRNSSSKKSRKKSRKKKNTNFDDD